MQQLWTKWLIRLNAVYLPPHLTSWDCSRIILKNFWKGFRTTPSHKYVTSFFIIFTNNRSHWAVEGIVACISLLACMMHRYIAKLMLIANTIIFINTLDHAAHTHIWSRYRHRPISIQHHLGKKSEWIIQYNNPATTYILHIVHIYS